MATQTEQRAHAGDGRAHRTKAGTPTVARGDYVVPFTHLRVPEAVVDAGFWGALAGAALLGVVDAPLALLIGGAVLVARHHTRSEP